MSRKWVHVVVVIGTIFILNLGVAAEPLKLTIDTFPNLVFEVVYPQKSDHEAIIEDLEKVEAIFGQEMTQVVIIDDNTGALYGQPPRLNGHVVYELPLGQIVSVFEGFAEAEFTVTVDTAIGWELTSDMDTISHTVETKDTVQYHAYRGATSASWPTLGIEYWVMGSGLVLYIVQLVLLCIAAPLVMYQGGTYVVNLVARQRRDEDLKTMISWISVGSTLVEIGLIYLGFRTWHWIPVGTYFLGFRGAFFLSAGSVLVSMFLLIVAGYRVEKRAKKLGVF